MSEEGYDLELSRKKLGALAPVLTDAYGNVIDGFHRQKIDPNWPKLKIGHITNPVQLSMAQVLEKPKHRKWNVTVVMVRPYTDFWLYRPTKEDILEALSDLIREGQLDSIFEIKIEEPKP